MGMIDRTTSILRPFFFGCIFGVVLMYGGLLADRLGYISLSIEHIFAAYSTIEPDVDGSSVSATQNSCGASVPNADCLDGDTSSSSAPTAGGSLTFASGNVDTYLMGDLTGVNSVNAIDVEVYHQEGNGNMAVYVSLWDVTETIQYGTEVQLTNRTTAQWDSARFSTTNFPLTSGELNGLRARLRCDRPGGGKADVCTVTAMFAAVDYSEQIDVTVGTTSAQQDLRIGTTSAHVGGAFTITENTFQRNITDITISETGSVNAQSSLDNIELWYEIDNDATPDCASESYNGGETQFGATDTDGFSGPNGTALFSMPAGPQISTTATMCVYVVLDVLNTAGIGETLEIQITDPSTQVVASTTMAVVEPNTPVQLFDTTTLLGDALTQTRYHWRQDNGDQTDNAVTGADSFTGGVENTSIDSASKDTHYRLRLAVSNEGNATSSATQFQVEYGEKSTVCSDISEANWHDVDETLDAWNMVDSTFITDGNTTNISTAGKGAMTDDNTNFIGTGALRETSSLSGSMTFASSDFTELEYSMNASSSIADGTTYCFRVTDNGTALPSYGMYPEITFNADVLVSAEEAQPSSLTIPSTGALLGSFLFSSTTGPTPSIDEITITASSTGDSLTTDFDNIALYWEYDTSVPVDCVSESYAGGETQYGATDADGFSVGGTSTFTQAISPPSVNASRALCVYAILDVTSSSSDGDLLDIAIANPSIDVVLSSGSVAPASEVAVVGVTTLTAPYVVQGNHHWRNNDNTGETDSTSATNGIQNTVLNNLAKNTTMRLRFDVSNIGGETSGNYQYRLEWAQKLSSCALASGWTDVDVPNDEFRMEPSLLVDNADTTDIASGIGGVTNQANTFDGTNAGQKDGTSQTNNLDLAADTYAELEYSIQATATSTESASYCFRVTNAGVPLANYLTYPETNIKFKTDFVVTRGVTTIANGSTSASIVNTGAYDLQLNDASRAFVRITNTGITGAGPATIGNNNASDVTAYVGNPGNIVNGITFLRAGTTGDTRIAWEVVEYIGATGGENEIVVRSAAVATYGTAATAVTTGTISGIVDDADVVPWITGQGNPDTGRFDYNTGISTSAWNAGGDTATFTRGEAGSDAVNVSYAIIEFTGANWIIQRSEHTYSQTPGLLEADTSINSVTANEQAFLHIQKRADANYDKHSDFGHEVYLNGVGTVQYRLEGTATTPSSGHTSVAWIIENTQNSGAIMNVVRSNGTIPSGGTSPTITNKDIGTTLDDLSIASIIAVNRSSTANRTFQEPIMSVRLTASTTQYELWVGDNSDTLSYRTQVIEWPTANAKLVQNYFQLYEDNDLITPDTAWSTLGENDEMLGSTNPIAFGESIRIRMSLNVTAATMPAGVDAFKLEFAERPPATTCSAVGESSWYAIGDIGSSTALWRGHDNATPADGATLPSTLLSVSDVTATYEEQNISAPTPASAQVGDDIEFDWSIENNGASDKTDYCFRMVKSNDVLLESYINYPVIRTVGYEPIQWDWQWFDDEGNITPSSSLALPNFAPIDVANDNLIKLRTIVSEVSGASGVDVKFKLQFSEYSDFSAGVFDVVSSSTCAQNATTTSALWCYVDAAGIDNAVIDSTTLANADACTAGSGSGCGTHNEGTASTTAALDQPALSNMEFEFTIENQGARANAVYYFRLFDVQNQVPVNASSSYPSLMVEGPSLVFTVSGISTGLGTEGVTTDVTTTPTAISFGSIPLDTEYEAAQRIAVDTNATQGYQILTFARQAFINTNADPIPDVIGTNASPTGWLTGCSGSAIGCIGYHAGDDTLGVGDVTRFAANDSYAAFDTTPQEIMYSSVPANETSDIVYKIQITGQQAPGEYETEIVYMAIPVF